MISLLCKYQRWSNTPLSVEGGGTFIRHRDVQAAASWGGHLGDDQGAVSPHHFLAAHVGAHCGRIWDSEETEPAGWFNRDETLVKGQREQKRNRKGESLWKTLSCVAASTWLLDLCCFKCRYNAAECKWWCLSLGTLGVIVTLLFFFFFFFPSLPSLWNPKLSLKRFYIFANTECPHLKRKHDFFKFIVDWGQMADKASSTVYFNNMESTEPVYFFMPGYVTAWGLLVYLWCHIFKDAICKILV